MKMSVLNPKRFVLILAVVLLTYGAHGISYAQVCAVGDILSPGESCVDPGTGDTFSVLADGRGRYLFVTAGTGITLQGSINGVARNFVATNRGDGSWEIESVTPGGTTPPVTEAGEVVSIPDANLRAVIERKLGKASGDTITTSEMANLTELIAPNAYISNLTGLEAATSLAFLHLGYNLISDISSLSGLTNLTRLSFDSNSTSDISPLSGLTNLTRLSLADNTITDISPLSGLTDLTNLGLSSNLISDISSLSGLTHLTYLNLWDNTISDISPLVANTGLGSGDTVDVRGNPLNAVSISTHIPTLQGRGVTIEFDPPQPVNIPDPNLRAKIEAALGKAAGNTITAAEMATLTHLQEPHANITDLTGLEHATNLTWLAFNEALGGEGLVNSNAITDLSPLSGLTNLTDLLLGGNNISDLSPLAGLTNLTRLGLRNNSITNISSLSGLTNLTDLSLGGNPMISDLSTLSGLTNLTDLNLSNNSISDISVVAGLTNLTDLRLWDNNISDISPLSGLTNLTDLRLWDNNISDISSLSGLTNLTDLNLSNNSISDISSLSGLTNLTDLRLRANTISDISPLVTNRGLGDGDLVNVDGNPLSYTSINTHIPTLQSRGVEVHANNLKPPTLEYLLSVSSGISLIHVPLKVTAVDGVAKTIEFISDLYDALGGVSMVNYLITYDTSTQAWLSYFSTADRGGAADQVLTDEMGIIAGMKTAITVRLRGNPLGTNGTSTIGLNRGLNLVGLPLRDSRITRVSDLLSLDGIRGNVPTIILSDAGDFKSVGRAGDPGDVPITGGQGFILTAQSAATVIISGEGWSNVSATAAAPQMLTGIGVTDTAPVLALKGEIVDEMLAVNQAGFRVAVKNLSTGRQVATTTADAQTGYRLTVVDIETMRAAQVGDILEISAQSPNPFIGVKPLRYTVTAEDVKQSLIRLPELVAYEIPTETKLLANYPNPFNPETWIPYRLAEDGFVTLTIYNANGHAVRTIDVGHRIAAVYESRSKAIYWAGRNNLGEQVASGVYFYHLNVGEYSQTRKMLILK